VVAKASRDTLALSPRQGVTGGRLRMLPWATVLQRLDWSPDSFENSSVTLYCRAIGRLLQASARPASLLTLTRSTLTIPRMKLYTALALIASLLLPLAEGLVAVPGAS
jgi:hypothetical protein